jgi:hypothetical protein
VTASTARLCSRKADTSPAVTNVLPMSVPVAVTKIAVMNAASPYADFLFPAKETSVTRTASCQCGALRVIMTGEPGLRSHRVLDRRCSAA